MRPLSWLREAVAICRENGITSLILGGPFNKEEASGGQTSQRNGVRWHEHCMTFSAEQPDKMNAAAGFRRWLAALGVSLATALLVIAPFVRLGNASGHDFGFHAASWLDVAGQWQEGILFPQWTLSGVPCRGRWRSSGWHSRQYGCRMHLRR